MASTNIALALKAAECVRDFHRMSPGTIRTSFAGEQMLSMLHLEWHFQLVKKSIRISSNYH